MHALPRATSISELPLAWLGSSGVLSGEENREGKAFEVMLSPVMPVSKQTKIRVATDG